MKTKVLFLKERDDNDVFAYFPEMVSDYKTKEKYIANGKSFNSYEEVVSYAAWLELRITNTETIRKGVYLISLNK